MAKKRYFQTLRRWTNFDYLLRKFKWRLREAAQKTLGIAELEQALSNLPYEMYDLIQRGEKLLIPRMATIDQTLEELLRSERSIARFGDGEFKYMFFGSSIGYQQYDEKLATRLQEVLASKDDEDDRVMIAMIDIFGCRPGMRSLAVQVRPHLNTCINDEQQYYNAMIARSVSNMAFVDRLKRLWNDRDVVIVEGSMTRMGIGNDLLANTRSIRRILAPAENAWSAYPQILEEAMRFDHSRLFLIALGPTATVLAYDLGMAGYRALDLGHLDICYELLLRGAQEMMPIAGKYVNEVSYRAPVACKDEKYLQQVVCSIDTKGTVTPGQKK